MRAPSLWIPRGLDTTEDKRQLLLLLVMLQAFFTAPLLICSFVAGGTANMGFNIVLTAILNSAYNASSYILVKKTSRRPLQMGLLIGSSSMMVLLNLMTAVYWGQLSKCHILPHYASLAQYTCDNPILYTCISVFAALACLSQAVFLILVLIWRDHLIEYALGEERDRGGLSRASSETMSF